jgi:DNA (cytosine-5)-methyltransferase 1
VTERPRLLDLFCGAGGASVGYSRAGFDVTGVDIRPMPRYPFRFVRADALDYLAEHGHAYAAIHASPPCQAHIRGGLQARDGRHRDLIGPTRELLRAVGRPWVIENVPGAPLRCDLLLCGSMFGRPIRRHRWFEGMPPLEPWTLACAHDRPIVGVYGHPHGRRGAWRGMLPSTLTTWADALGIDWMSAPELAQAIPPCFTEHVGHLLRGAGP